MTLNSDDVGNDEYVYDDVEDDKDNSDNNVCYDGDDNVDDGNADDIIHLLLMSR